MGCKKKEEGWPCNTAWLGFHEVGPSARIKNYLDSQVRFREKTELEISEKDKSMRLTTNRIDRTEPYIQAHQDKSARQKSWKSLKPQGLKGLKGHDAKIPNHAQSKASGQDSSIPKEIFCNLGIKLLGEMKANPWQ